MPEGEPVRAKLSTATQLQKEQFYFDGATFGYCHESDAIASDGSAPVVSTTGRIGRRHGRKLAPDYWLFANGERVSTVDLSDGCFLARRRTRRPRRRSSRRSRSWAPLYELRRRGAVLIRPKVMLAGGARAPRRLLAESSRERWLRWS